MKLSSKNGVLSSVLRSTLTDTYSCYTWSKFKALLVCVDNSKLGLIKRKI